MIRMEWETISTPYFVNLSKQLSHTLDESSERKDHQTSLSSTPTKWRLASKWNQNPSSFRCCKARGHWKREYYKYKHSLRAFSPLTRLSDILPVLHDEVLRNSRDLFSILLLSSLGCSPDWGLISSSPNWPWSLTLRCLTHCMKQPLPQSIKTVQIIEALFSRVSCPWTCSSYLAPLRDTHHFSYLLPYPFIRLDFWEILCQNFLSLLKGWTNSRIRQ